MILIVFILLLIILVSLLYNCTNTYREPFINPIKRKLRSNMREIRKKKNNVVSNINTKIKKIKYKYDF